MMDFLCISVEFKHKARAFWRKARVCACVRKMKLDCQHMGADPKRPEIIKYNAILVNLLKTNNLSKQSTYVQTVTMTIYIFAFDCNKS